MEGLFCLCVYSVNIRQCRWWRNEKTVQEVQRSSSKVRKQRRTRQLAVPHPHLLKVHEACWFDGVIPEPVTSACVDWYNGASADGISCELEETCVEYVCCFIWQAAYKRKENHMNVKERSSKNIVKLLHYCHQDDKLQKCVLRQQDAQKGGKGELGWFLFCLLFNFAPKMLWWRFGPKRKQDMSGILICSFVLLLAKSPVKILALIKRKEGLQTFSRIT